MKTLKPLENFVWETVCINLYFLFFLSQPFLSLFLKIWSHNELHWLSQHVHNLPSSYATFHPNCIHLRLGPFMLQIFSWNLQDFIISDDSASPTPLPVLTAHPETKPVGPGKSHNEWDNLHCFCGGERGKVAPDKQTNFQKSSLLALKQRRGEGTGTKLRGVLYCTGSRGPLLILLGHKGITLVSRETWECFLGDTEVSFESYMYCFPVLQRWLWLVTVPGCSLYDIREWSVLLSSEVLLEVNLFTC